MTASPPAAPRTAPRGLIPLLGLLSIFPPIATDLYLSAIGRMQQDFQAPDGGIELTLSIFFLGLGAGQLLYGPAIDAFGRRRPLLIGAGVFCLASIGALLARDLELFTLMRFIQALGACSGMIIGRAVIADLFEGAEAARAQTLVMAVVSIGPICAPFLGSLLVSVAPWRSAFVAMLAMGALALILAFRFLPETLPPAGRTPLAPGRIAARWSGLLASRAFMAPALTGGFGMAAMFSFITGSASLFMERFGLSETGYGAAFGAVALGLVISSQLNARLLMRHAPGAILSVAAPAQAAAAVALLLALELDAGWLILPPLWLAVACVGFIGGNATAIAMQAARGAFGAGSALMGAVQFGLGFAVTAAVSAAPGGPGAGLGLGMAGGASAAALVWFLDRGRRREAAAAAAAGAPAAA